MGSVEVEERYSKKYIFSKDIPSIYELWSMIDEGIRFSIRVDEDEEDIDELENLSEER